MKKGFCYSLILFSQLFLSCSHPIKEKIIGIWSAFPTNECSYEFKSNNKFELRNGDIVLEQGKYYIKPESNSLYLYSETLDGIDSIPIRFTYRLDSNLLYLCCYKNLPPIYDNIDEVSIFKLENSISKPVIDTTKTQIIYFDGNLIGNYLINYNQQDSEQTFDIQGRIHLHVSKSKLTKTKFKADPFEYIKGNFIFKDNRNNVISSFIMSSCQQNPTKLLTLGYNKDSVYVCLYGYNQETRENINRFFSKDINGQVLMFRVDTLKNFIKNSNWLAFPLYAQ